MSKVATVGATALFACILCATPLSVSLSPEGNVALSVDSASAVIGRPLTPGSVAGVNRRAHRRAYRHGYYGTGAYYNPNRYGYGTYQGYSGYAYQPYNRYRTYQQPYYGYGNRQWWQFGSRDQHNRRSAMGRSQPAGDSSLADQTTALRST